MSGTRECTETKFYLCWSFSISLVSSNGPAVSWVVSWISSIFWIFKDRWGWEAIVPNFWWLLLWNLSDVLTSVEAILEFIISECGALVLDKILFIEYFCRSTFKRVWSPKGFSREAWCYSRPLILNPESFPGWSSMSISFMKAPGLMPMSFSEHTSREELG